MIIPAVSDQRSAFGYQLSTKKNMAQMKESNDKISQ
jgi:hypothetical protein